MASRWRKRAELVLASTELLHWDNRRSPADGSQLPVASKQALRKRAGLKTVSSELLHGNYRSPELPAASKRALRKRAIVRLASTELLCWDNRRSAANGPKLPAASRQALRKRAGLRLVSTELLCGQPQAPCSLQAVSWKLQTQLFLWRCRVLWFGQQELLKFSMKVHSSCPIGLLSRQDNNQFKRIIQFQMTIIIIEKVKLVKCLFISGTSESASGLLCLLLFSLMQRSWGGAQAHSNLEQASGTAFTQCWAQKTEEKWRAARVSPPLTAAWHRAMGKASAAPGTQQLVQGAVVGQNKDGNKQKQETPRQSFSCKYTAAM